MIKNLLIVLSLTLILSSNDRNININFDDLSITKLIHLTSKIIKRNILITQKIDGKVDFISHSALTKEELLALLIQVLNSKNFTLIEEGTILKVIPIKNKTINTLNKKIKTIALTRSTNIIKLKNLDTKKIIVLIGDIVKSFKGKLFATFEHESNTIILMGNKQHVGTVSQIIKTLDVKKTQVYVEAKIIEVSEVRTKNLGLKYGIEGGKLRGSSLYTFSTALNEGKTIALDSSINDYTPLKMVSVFALGATINLLKENLALEIISEPSILCLDNQESSIYVGETRSIKTGTTNNAGNITDSYIRENIGLTLIVKPRVLDNEILLDIKTVLEDIKEAKTLSGNPVTLKKEIITTAIVKNGESVILGGLIKDKLDYVTTSVPLLGDIPILGNLFKNKKNIKDKINLVIIITPHIVDKNQNLYMQRKYSLEI